MSTETPSKAGYERINEESMFLSRVERVVGFMSRVEGTMSRVEGNFVFPIFFINKEKLNRI